MSQPDPPPRRNVVRYLLGRMISLTGLIALLAASIVFAVLLLFLAIL